MVKLEDGSMVLASQLLGGDGQDDDGKSLKFKSNDDATVPVYTAEAPMRDGSNRKKIYSFDLGNTQVRVSVSTVEPEPEEKDKSKKEKEKEGEDEEAASKKSASLESEGFRTSTPATEARVVKTSPGKSNTR